VSKQGARDWRIFLGDMQSCIGKIQGYTAGMTLESFSNNPLVMDATLRNLEILGEAATNIPPEVRSQFQSIPWREIVDTRNKLIHGYAGLDDEIVWDIVSHDIPRLAGLLAEMSLKGK
jgi:uncharacterized protein with HEPN domain